MEATRYFFKEECHCVSVTGEQVDIAPGIYNVVELVDVAIHLSQGRVFNIPAADFASLKAQSIVSVYREIP